MNREPKLIDPVVITICAVISGADDWVSVADYGEDEAEWLATCLELPGGIPAHDTFWRVFRQLASKVFQECFLNWISAIRIDAEHEIIAIDGKQLRGSQVAPAATRHVCAVFRQDGGGPSRVRLLDSLSGSLTNARDIDQTQGGLGRVSVEGDVALVDGITAPGTLAGHALLYVDAADGDLKVRFGDGVVKTIVTDS
jgi:hypothetical protein